MAVLSGIVLNKLKIPTIIGYILTGVLTTYFFDFRLDSSQDLNHIAEMGIVFLMFMIGLDFSLKTMLSMKQEVLVFGVMQIGFTIIGFFIICHYLFGFDFATSFIVASAISLSSTAIILKYLNETNQAKTQYGSAGVGILIFQDIAVIPILLIIKILSTKDADITTLLLTTFISVVLVLLVLFLPGKFFAKLVLRYSANMKTDEIFVATVFLIVLGAAYVSQYFGFSMSLGAFLAGMIISNTPYKYQVGSVLVYFRDILLGVFFITVGMQVDVVFLLKYFVIILFFVALMMFAKTFFVYAFLRFFRGDRIGMRVALSLAQIGEFSFAIFLLANQHEILNLNLTGGILKYIFGNSFFSGITPAEIYQFLTLMVIFSMIATPFILDRIDKATDFMLNIIRFPFSKKKVTEEEAPQEEAQESQDDLENHIIVCGYGVVGREIAAYLRGCNVKYVCIDSNYNRVEKGIKRGDNVVFGDVTHKSILKQFNIEKAVAVIITLNTPEATFHTCRDVVMISRRCKIIASTKQKAVEEELKAMGLYAVIHERKELASILGRFALDALEESKQLEASSDDSKKENKDKKSDEDSNENLQKEEK